MSDTIQIIVNNDESDARVAEQKLQLKGYQTKVSKTKTVVMDGRDLGGSLEMLNDPDDEVFVVVGTK